GNLYYAVVDPNHPDSVQLAATADGALAAAPATIPLVAPDGASLQSLTRVFSFGHVGTLQGGRQNDTFGLLAGGSLTGSTDGGTGLNTVQGPNADADWSVPDRALNRPTTLTVGTAAALPLSNIQALLGGRANDTFVLTVGSAATPNTDVLRIDGGA